MTTSDLGEGESAVGSIHEAIDDDDMDELEDLLRWKPNLKEKCQKLGETRGFSPIMKAAFLGNAKAMDLLIDYGANVNEVDSLGYTVLMRSVLARSLDCVKLLVDAGAVINYVQKTVVMDLGLSAIKLGELMRETEIVKVLREAGADSSESASEKRRRKAKEQSEVFRSAVSESDLDIDVDALLRMTAEDLKMTNNNDLDVTVHVNGTNTTIKQRDSAQKYAEMANEARIADEKDAAAGDAEDKPKKCSIDDDESGECAYDPNAAVNVESLKDEL
jgi:ankyrin repeat protein